MSRIEEALKKLQRAQSKDAVARAVTPVRRAVPVTSKKKIAFHGPKHPVSREALIEAGLLAAEGQSVSLADEFRRIKRPVIANATQAAAEDGSRMNVVMVTSAMPGAGKTFCSVNLAASISIERELNVMLVDADVAKPHISREFGLEGMPGLIDVLVDDKCDVADVLVRTDLNDLQVLPAGRKHPHATELLASDRMTHVIRELAERYGDRIILLDSPPLLATSEAHALANQVGQILLVVEAGETSHGLLTQTLETLDRGKVINLILNKTRHTTLGGYYPSGYGAYGNEGAE